LFISLATITSSAQELLCHPTISQTIDTYSHVLPGLGYRLADEMDDTLASGFAVREQ
jgi:hypothetical protein